MTITLFILIATILATLFFGLIQGLLIGILTTVLVQLVIAPSPGPSHIPPSSAALPAVPPATPGGPRPNPPNPKKYYNNWNYCYSCGYDIPSWHTSQTCNNPKPHHQQGCTRANVAAYKAAGHLVSERNAHKTILPINPGQHQA